MTEPELPFFNFSLTKVIAGEPDYFKRAKIRIILTILLLTICKTIVAIAVAMQHNQHLQVLRAVVIMVLFGGLIKVMLYRPKYATAISHVLVISGIVMIWLNLLIYAHYVNIVTVQIIFMTALAGYYLIGGRMAGWYTVLAIIPVVYNVITLGTNAAYIKIPAQELPSPGMEIILLLNFATFALIHYLYSRAFEHNLYEKISLNKQLQANIIEAKALAESRSVFLSTMSHELRTPLNGVIGMTHLIKDTAVEEQRDYINALEFSATNLLSVVNDILDYNKIELNKIELEALPVNLPALMKKICMGLEMKAAEKGLSWKLKIDKALYNYLVITDPTRLTQIVYNLVGNAIKFTDNGSVSVYVKVAGQTESAIGVDFIISDTGIGIEADRQEAVFDLFTQASSATTRKYGGTGLGLAIVKKLLGLFNSSIQLQSQPNKGSVFTFNLQLKYERGKKEPLGIYNTTQASLKGMRILIAEDNHVNVLLLQRLLTKWHVETTVATNGQEAVDCITDNNFDLVLMDIHMPVMDGYEATKAIRLLTDPAKSNIPVIAITASVSQKVDVTVKEAGMQDFLPKPFQPDQLLNKLQNIYKQVR